ncbi:uroporphyrinogen decarboxylase [Sciscionella sediminilitoris]|uniref:uroporphyrinogen decarboxylase n=1 Tax=Sciscionella sediminilitoris TaxID=1445613 RepID=UPI0004DFA734|nr:uroporphyrinogen decarboxylase [Sciscionella sp. SE31]
MPNNRRDLAEAPFLRAARGERPERTPVWFMRQAGRSLPEYHEVRAGAPMLQSCLTPDVAREITMQPVRRHGVDAAVLYSDIMVPLYAAGIELEITPGVGPVIAEPVRTRADVERLPELDPAALAPIAEAVRLLTGELGEVPLIGFAGAPFTLASYLVEGAPSKTYERTKAMMLGDPETWNLLAAKLARMTSTFLRVQAEAGVDAVQVFDSWAGALPEREYRESVLPHTRAVFDSIGEFGVPRIHFGVGTGELLPAMAEAGVDVVGVDWRIPLDEAAARLRAAGIENPVVQGNLDPTVLFAGEQVVERETARVLAEGKAAAGHIFNLGHGVLPNTDPAELTRLVDLVHRS